MNWNPIVLYRKIKKHGIRGSWKIGLNLLKWDQKAWILVRLRFYVNLCKLLFGRRPRRKCLLGIWDWASLPWSVGDPLMFVEDLNILKIRDEYDRVDICVVFDGAHPGKSLRPTNLTPETSQSYALDFLPLFSMCHGLGRVVLFNDRKNFYCFLEQNLDRYEFYPSLPQHLGQKFNYYGGAYWEVILSFYDKHKYLPHLKVSTRDRRWAMNFFKTHVRSNEIPVVMSLKNTRHCIHRNADPDLWYEFLERCAREKPEIRFVLVGLRGETDQRILQLPNIIFSKNYGTSMLQDVALVGSAPMYVGPTSGIGTIPLLSDIPYLITNFELKEYPRLGIAAGENLPFAAAGQKIFPVSKKWTVNLLFKEFCSIFHLTDKKKWDEERFLDHLDFEHPSTSINKQGNKL